MAGSMGTKLYDFIHGENYPLETKEETARRKKQEAAAAKSPPAPGTVQGAQQTLGGRKSRIDAEVDKAVGDGLPGKQAGGFTGNVPVDAPAAVAHGQEYVIPADVVNFLGSRYFDRILEQARQQMGQGSNPIMQFDASLDEEM